MSTIPLHSLWLCWLLAVVHQANLCAQSSRPGSRLIAESFDSQTIDTTRWSNASWQVDNSWEWKDGAIAGIFERERLGVSGHGKPIQAKLPGLKDLRVVFRFQLVAPHSQIEVLPNGKFSFSALPHEHIARLRLSLDGLDQRGQWLRDGGYDLGFVEDGYSEDPRDPKLEAEAKPHPRGAYRYRGPSLSGPTQLQPGVWHTAVLEIHANQWTAWIDGREQLIHRVLWQDIPIHSVAFLSQGSILLDDIVIEKL